MRASLIGLLAWSAFSLAANSNSSLVSSNRTDTFNVSEAIERVKAEKDAEPNFLLNSAFSILGTDAPAELLELPVGTCNAETPCVNGACCSGVSRSLSPLPFSYSMESDKTVFPGCSNFLIPRFLASVGIHHQNAVSATARRTVTPKPNAASMVFRENKPVRWESAAPSLGTDLSGSCVAAQQADRLCRFCGSTDDFCDAEEGCQKDFGGCGPPKRPSCSKDGTSSKTTPISSPLNSL